jgi:U4/U6 small nuclear ribonucleoprotein PRP31
LQLRALEQTQKGGSVSKKMQKRLKQQQQLQNASSGLATTLRNSSVSGTASVSFTPLQVRRCGSGIQRAAWPLQATMVARQGLEIVAPKAREKPRDDGKYFGASAGFLNVNK